MERNLNSKCLISSQKNFSKSSDFIMEEFTINKFLKLKLEDDKTIIYVNNERFNQCKFLFLDISIEEATSLEDIESIDDVAQRLDRTLEGNNESRRQYVIPPEVEFWGHCSNLQVWYENDYNTKLLHRNLAFPLLWKLTEVSDSLAERVFKEEIAIRFSEGNETVREYIRAEGYLGHLDNDQFLSLLYGIKFNSFSELLKIIGTYFIIDRKSIVEFFELIESLDNRTLREFIINHKEINQLNFYQALIDYLGEYREGHPECQMFRNGFKKIGIKSFDSLMKLIINNDGYIDLSVLENLIYINSEKMKDFLMHTKHKIKFGFEIDLWDFQHILNVLLRCLEPEVLMIYLEKYCRKDLIQIILPKIHGYKYLKMSDQIEIDMKYFIIAFLLEEAGTVDYRENLEKLGDFLADTFLSELIDRNNEINEDIIKTLAWVGGKARIKLIEKLFELFDDLVVDMYRKKFREYFRA